MTDGNAHATVYTLDPTHLVQKVTDPETSDHSSGKTTFEYDAGYNLKHIVDPLNHETWLTYEDYGNLLTRENARHEITTYVYTPENDLWKMQDARQHWTIYDYQNGNLMTVTDPLNNITQYGYNEYGQRTSFKDANAVANNLPDQTTYDSYPSGYLKSVTDPASNQTIYTYDAVGNRTQVTDALLHRTTYVYDDSNRLREIHAPVDADTFYTYDANGNRTKVVDAESHKTDYIFDSLNRVQSVQDALDQQTQNVYDNVGNRTHVIDANGHDTEYQYDELNRVRNIFTSAPFRYRTSFQYDATGNRTFVTNARRFTTEYRYDDANRLTFIIQPSDGLDPRQPTTEYRYDHVGNRTHVIDTNTRDTQYDYNALNQVFQITDARGNETKFQYDAVGNRRFQTEVLASGDRVTEYRYDALNRVEHIIAPNTKSQDFTYDKVGNRLTVTDGAGQVTTYTYDELNRRHTEENAQHQVTTYGYDPVGNLLKSTDASGLETKFDYNEANRQTKKYAPIGEANAPQWSVTQYGYDPVGNLTQMTIPSNAQSAYHYDELNRVTSEERFDANNTRLVTYSFDAYDASNDLLQETEARPNQNPLTTTYTYDNLDRNTSIKDAYGSQTGYTYDLAGNLTSTIDPSGLATSVTPNGANLPETTTTRDQNQNVAATTTNTYTNANELESWTTTDPVNNLTLHNDLHYNANCYLDEANVSHTGTFSASLTSSEQYKDNNLLGTWTQSGGSDNHFLYDGAGRLKCSEYGELADEYLKYDGSGRRTERYWQLGYNSCDTLDADPSILGRSGVKHSIYTYDGNRLTTEDASEYGGSFYSRTQSYDTDGNVKQMAKTTSSGTVTLDYGWEPGMHHLLNVTRSVNGTVQYTASFEYDRLDRITKYCPNGGNCQHFSYVGDSDWLSTVKDQNGTVLQCYLYVNGHPLRVDTLYISSLNPNYYRYNARGDVAVFVQADGSGATSCGGEGAWGTLNWWEQGIGCYNWNTAWGYMWFPPKFNFDVNDDMDMGLYFAHGRWYNQDTGLWLSPNEKGDYLYGGNGQDPVNKAGSQKVMTQGGTILTPQQPFGTPTWIRQIRRCGPSWTIGSRRIQNGNSTMTQMCGIPTIRHACIR